MSSEESDLFLDTSSGLKFAATIATVDGAVENSPSFGQIRFKKNGYTGITRACSS
jgi:hypothetical protein